MATREAKTNIVMPSWNGIDFTEAALKRLDETIGHPYYLTVVDNGSVDGTPNFLKRYRPSKNCIGYTAVLNSINRGPGGAYQQGYEESIKLNTPYTVLSNNDVYFTVNWLQKLEDTMDQNADIGILGTLQPVSKVIHPMSVNNAKQELQAAPAGLTIPEELATYFHGVDFDTGAQLMIEANGGGLHDITAPPDAIPTSCAIVNNDAVERIGHVADPRFEIYGSEDIDLSWSLGKLGYRCAVLNDVYIHHFRHRSSNKSGLDFKQCLKINNAKFVQKWYDEIAHILDDPTVRRRFSTASAQDELTKLRRINENVGFYVDDHMVPRSEL